MTKLSRLGQRVLTTGALAALLLAAPMQEADNTAAQEETQAAEAQKFTVLIDATIKGTIAHVYVELLELENQHTSITSYLVPTATGKKLDVPPEPKFTITVDETYASSDDLYDGVILPLRLRWLATERSKRITALHSFEQEITAQEKKLLRCAEDCYKDFSRIHLAKQNAYAFSNLATQVEIKFAGESFYSLNRVARKILHKEDELRTRKIYYKKRLRHKAPDSSMSEQVDEIYRTALALPHGADLAPLALEDLPVTDSAKNDKLFMQLTYDLVRLRQARLLLARVLFHLYEPQQLLFLFPAEERKGEKLNVTLFIDDRHHRDSELRYVMRTTSVNHKREFTLGHVKFDRHLRPKGMWLSMKPRQGVPGFVKLTFKLHPDTPLPDDF